MKKLLLALLFIVGSMGYIVIQRGLDEQASSSALTAVGSSSSATPVSEAFAKVENAVQAVTPTQKTTGISQPRIPSPTKGQYTDGTFTGSAVSQPYGTVQVAVVVSGGRITNVKLLRSPSGGGTTQYINEQALPMLVEEVISAQSGNIDGISGASLTSPAFIDSVTSALAKARA
jgi:uncharacterized protein with FMN-binding domain